MVKEDNVYKVVSTMPGSCFKFLAKKCLKDDKTTVIGQEIGVNAVVGNYFHILKFFCQVLVTPSAFPSSWF